MKKVAFAFAAVAMAGALTTFTTTPAFAGTESVTIDTSAYNLRSASGYAALTSRIDRASKQVCGTVNVRDIAGAYEVRSCQAESVDDAVAQLENLARTPTVTIGASR